MIKIIECPRDAMQGIQEFIPTEKKIAYINKLLEVGFDTIDAGSFVSPKSIPQLRDTADVFSKLNLSHTQTNLLAIIANLRGAEQACIIPQLRYMGFPLSISETFQKRNTNKTIHESILELEKIQSLSLNHKKIVVVYLSMGFGNPYGDPFHIELVEEFIDKLIQFNITIISLADTIGVSTKENITYLFNHLSKKFPTIELGAHLHSHPSTVYEKIDAAYQAGCRRFDGALKGLGGCPMAKDELVGNIATEKLIDYFNEKKVNLPIHMNKLHEALAMIPHVFPKH